MGDGPFVKKACSGAGRVEAEALVDAALTALERPEVQKLVVELRACHTSSCGSRFGGMRKHAELMRGAVTRRVSVGWRPQLGFFSVVERWTWLSSFSSLCELWKASPRQIHFNLVCMLTYYCTEHCRPLAVQRMKPSCVSLYLEKHACPF